MKTYVTTLVLFLCLTGNGTASDCSPNCNARSAETDAILAAAQPKFDELLEKAEPAKPTYGFDTQDILGQAVLGEPIPVYTVNPDDVCEYCDGEDIEPLLTESGQWLVPITINGELRTFIEVSKTPTNGYLAQRGSIITARVWKTIIERWPLDKNFHPKLVVYGNIPGYFFTVPEVYPQNMTDIVRILAEVDTPAALSPATVILHSWRADKARTTLPDISSRSAIANHRPPL